MNGILQQMLESDSEDENNFSIEDIENILYDISSSRVKDDRGSKLICGWDVFSSYLKKLHNLSNTQYIILTEMLPGGLYEVSDDPLTPFKLDGVEIGMNRLFDLIKTK